MSTEAVRGGRGLVGGELLLCGADYAEVRPGLALRGGGDTYGVSIWRRGLRLS